jgi:hypothetical protein
MNQYPHRLVANSWNLAQNEGSRAVGFSGTNDNHLILPLQILQYLPWNTEDETWKQLLSTNGRMLDIMLQQTRKVEQVQDENGNNSLAILAYVQSLFASQHPVHALIDSGALLAGYTNSEVANLLLGFLPDDLLGVVFFNNNSQSQTKEWVLLERSGRCLPKEQSPINEKDAFALFDEPRCRGSDLKLRPDAVAVLTLGRGMCKDKFMQGAGRMRKLHEDQSLIIVANSEVHKEVQSIAAKGGEASAEESINTKDVLSWVMQNTIKSIWKGLSSWTDQGLFFATSSKPQHAKLPERNDLNTMYGAGVTNSPLDDLASSLKEYHRNRTCFDEESSMVTDIVSRCQDLGQSYSILRTGAEEECERELQLEVEEQQEEQVEEEKMIPMGESDWDYSSIFRAPSISALHACDKLSLHDVISRYLSVESLSRLLWSGKIFCTNNFVQTILNNQQQKMKLDRCLRTADFMIRFPSDEYLLLSEREANALLQEFWKKRDSGETSQGYYLCQRSFECDKMLKDSSLLRIGSAIKEGIDDHVASSLQLFAGDTMYESEGRRVALKKILSVVKRDSSKIETEVLSDITGQPEELVRMRGKFGLFEMSDLESVCSTLISEIEARNVDQYRKHPLTS